MKLDNSIIEHILDTFGSPSPGTGCTFIAKDGTYVNIYPKLDVHEDLCEWVEDEFEIELDYCDEEYFVREFGWIRLRSDPRMSIVELPSSVPTNDQWWALDDWLEWLEEKHAGQKVTLYLQVCDNHGDTDVPYDFGSNIFTDGMMKMMKKYYSTGRLYAKTERSTEMKRVIKAASLVDTFMKYHEDANNYHNNEDGFDKMYAILEKYGDESEDVDVAFKRATPEDQRLMKKYYSTGRLYAKTERSTEMKRVIKAASLVDTFMKYHEDANNYHNNEDGFDKMYAILEKYGDESEDVDVAFKRATPEDQRLMVELIKPKPRHPGERGYTKYFYNAVINGDFEDASRDYMRGVEDLFHALVSEGYIDREDFREDQ